MSIANQIEQKLNQSIIDIAESLDKYVKRPGRDFTRNRKLNHNALIKLILSMKGNSLNKGMYDYSKISNISLTASAFVQQRNKIHPKLFEDLFHAFNQACSDPKTFHGYRLYAVDGSDLNIPRDPDADTFITSSENPRGYNQYHLNVLFDLCNKVYADCVLQPRPQYDERGALITMLNRSSFHGKNLIIGDRGFESYNMLAHLLRTNNVDFLLRVKQDANCMAEIRKLQMETLDKDIDVSVTTTQTNEDKRLGRRFIQTGSKNGRVNSSKTSISRWDFESPYRLSFRAVRFMLDNGEYETVVTSLDRKAFPYELIKELYHMRWGVETSFRELKYAIGLVNIHAKKDELIRQDIFASLIMYNFCERITGAVVVQRKIANVYTYQVNYTMAIHICRDFYAQSDKFGLLVLDEIQKYILPIRPGRRDKRNMKNKTVVSFLYRIAA